ncbi:MAG: hypothetical protein IPM60_07915 [Rhodospirillales bacterium]|nr:hypothetical protein [Rhodospirillales bacterium]
MKKVLAVCTGLAVVACSTARVPNEAQLSDLMLYDSTAGEYRRYTEVVGPLTLVEADEPDLPLVRIQTSDVPEAATWLRAYDLNNDGVVDESETCQAWLIKLAEEKTGNTYAPEALRSDAGQVEPLREHAPQTEQALCVPLRNRQAIHAELAIAAEEFRADLGLPSVFGTTTLAGPGGAGGPGGSGGDGGGDGGGGGGAR